MLILGLDPGLGTTGWGMIRAEGNRLAHVANGQIRTDPKMNEAGPSEPIAPFVLSVVEARAAGAGVWGTHFDFAPCERVSGSEVEVSC